MDKELLRSKISDIEKIISSYLPEAGRFDERITDAVRYSVQSGGKRLRPMLMQEMFVLMSGDAVNVQNVSDESLDMLHRFMAAIEFIHTYSLVHDDLPAMDNDDLRRGKPTTHKVYGEAFGVLAGDALLNLAFETVLDGMDAVKDPVLLKRSVSALRILAIKAGIRGMIGGQCLDVYTEKTEGAQNDISEITYIYENKTAALLEAACMTGGCLAGADRAQLDIIEDYASQMGMAFQIRDDILDIISTEEVLGKPIGSDEKNNKITYAVLKGLDEAQQSVEAHTANAVESLQKLPFRNIFLEELTGYLINREK